MDLRERPLEASGGRHPWELARYAFFSRVLAEAGALPPGTRVLDLGAGDAWFSRSLVQAHPGVSVVCCDPGYTEHGLPSGAPGAPGAIAFATGPPEDEPFDVVLLLDVAEHVADDAALATTAARSARAPDGHVLVSVPAWPSLFSAHDVRLAHHRRYTPHAARGLVERAGLEIVRSGGLFHSLLLPRALEVALERLGRRPAASDGCWRAPAPVTRLVVELLSLDTRASRAFARRGWELPGLSWWALCKRRRSSSSRASTRRTG